MELPSRLTNRPVEQVLHALHDVALFVVLNVPVGHGLQTRLATAVPSLLANWPVPQTIHATHGLAGL